MSDSNITKAGPCQFLKGVDGKENLQQDLRERYCRGLRSNVSVIFRRISL